MAEEHEHSTTDYYLSRASLSPRHANLIRRITIEDQVLEDGRLNYKHLFRRDAALSLAVDRNKQGEVARQVAVWGIFASVLSILLKLAF